MLCQSMPPTRVDPDSYTPIQGDTLGERIASAMKRAGLNKTELARACGVRWATVHEWTKQPKDIEADNIRRIAEVTGVSVDELLGVAAGQEPSFKAWKQLTAHLEAEGDALTDDEARALKSVAWPSEPTLGAYLQLLQTIRSLG